MGAGAESSFGSATVEATGGGATAAVRGGCGWLVWVSTRAGAGVAATRVLAGREGSVAETAGCACAFGCGFFAAGCGTGWSAGRVTVPLRLKFWRLPGPTALGSEGVEEAGACWAGATAGASASAVPTNAFPKRENALIRSASQA